VHCGDVVRFDLDLELGTLEMFINNVSQGILFRDVGGRVVPIVECHVVNPRSSSLSSASVNGGNLLRSIELVNGRVNLETMEECPLLYSENVKQHKHFTHLLCGVRELDVQAGDIIKDDAEHHLLPSKKTPSDVVGRHGVLPRNIGAVEVGGVFQPHSISMLPANDQV
jgi:hypothetical protein